ncbi:MAG: formylglycine-generating enzyme family protein [Phycisphaerae bacterium]|nr:formylglycine-generating enzyme family protein [Phycisphaerae bacterium]
MQKKWNGLWVAAFAGTVLAVVAMAASAGEPLPIIPGAAGFGMDTPAGSGRHLEVPKTRVIKVTNLNDSGPGSLRAALAAKGPRVAVFEVSGYIEVNSGMGIGNPYVTVAGQTAPWPGIVVRGGFDIAVRAHDVLVQHIAFRGGDSIEGRYMPHRGWLDVGRNSRNVIIDHCSTGWTPQCGLNMAGQKATARFCIVSEGWYEAGHNEDEHAKGMFVNTNRIKMTESVAVVGCLLAHNCDRNPDVMNGARLVFANNVVYNYAATGLKMIESSKGRTNAGKDSIYTLSVVGNAFVPGIDTGGDPQRPWRGKPMWIYLSNPKSRVFLSPDNLINGKTYANPWEQINARRWMDDGNSKPDPKAVVGQPPLEIPGYDVKPARETEAWVLANVGPFPARRNPIDARVVFETRTRTGRGRDDLADAGGWPKIEENRRKLTLPKNPNGDDDSDGYTNLEEWLHAFADEVEGRKGPIPGTDPALGKREAERCAKRPSVLDPESVRKIRETKADWTFDAAEAKRRQQAAAEESGLAVTRRIALADGVAIELALIPSGEFLMGSKYPGAVTKARGTGGVNLYRREYPVRRVRITRPYYMGQYEVTGAVWANVMNAKVKGDARLPVELKTGWATTKDVENIDVFLVKLNETVGKKEGLTFRLPTEAEWEYACRAGTDTPFWFGEQITPKQANYNGAPWSLEPREMPYQPRGKKPESPPRKQMMQVGGFAPNPWGLYDTVGNASELAQGSYGPYSKPKKPGAVLVDPQGPTRGIWRGIRITRGGNWRSYPSECRSAYGGYLAVYGNRERCGLRLVATPVNVIK